MPDYRSLVVAAARSQIGNSDPGKYWLDVLRPPQAHPVDKAGNPLAWCGAFALWCVHQAGAGEGVIWIPGDGFLFKCRRTTTPQIGDIAYRNEPFRHHAVIVDTGRDGIGPISTVDGNSAGGRVVPHDTVSRHLWTAFYSIDPLLPAGAIPVTSRVLTPAERVQTNLAALGLYTGKIDNAPGPKTQAALLAWALANPESIR